MAAIFPASFWPIVFMTGTLETAKVITVVWLHQHWSSVGKLIRLYLCIAVIVLMGITSMGVFGFLSKAHIAYQVKIDTGIGQELSLIEKKIETKRIELENAESEIKRIDVPVDKLTELSKRASEARAAIRATGTTKKEREKLVASRDAIQTEISTLEADKIRIESEITLQEAEVGPIKYLANLLYGEATKEQLEKAVRAAIIVLVLVFDPLAIMLLLGVSSIYKRNKQQPKPAPASGVVLGQPSKRPYVRKKKNTLEISKDDITKFN